MDGNTGLVARQHHLHRRKLQECRETHLREGEEVNATAFKALIRQAVALNCRPKKLPLRK